MIDVFEKASRVDPDGLFFSYTDKDGARLSYSYYESRLVAAAFAIRLKDMGLQRGDAVLVDVPNCPELVFTVLACAYGGFVMVIVDHGLSDGEKLSRRLEVERSGLYVRTTLDYRAVRQLLYGVRWLSEDPTEIAMSILGRQRTGRAIMGKGQDLYDETVHFAERSAHLFDQASLAAIVFSEDFGGSGVPDRRAQVRAIPLSWDMISGSAYAFAAYFDRKVSSPRQERLPFNSFSNPSAEGTMSNRPASYWQFAGPLTHTSGIQVLYSTVVMRQPLMVYTGLEPEQMLRDAERGLGTYMIADDRTLQDLMSIEEWRAEVLFNATSRLSLYKAVLLLWQDDLSHTSKRAFDLGMNLLIGYGMSEMSGCMAIASATGDAHIGLGLLDGYGSQVIDPDEDGRGSLAVAGPGMFDGYLNANTPFTVDRYFITKDLALMEDGSVFIENRSRDQFLSAGQTIFPLEVADVLRHVPGVSAVHVFGVPDSRCGMLPVAVIERSDERLTSHDVADRTRFRFKDYSVPISIFIFDDLPRNERGKLDRPAIESFFAA